jgi:tRNA dimethylallyltransferase
MPCLYFITGPTAVGKSDLALEWANKNDADILYCDASCVYRGMDIGTAKPDAAERALVPHHGLDLSDAAKSFCVADYVAEAHRVVEDCERRGRTLLVSGGSGFYLRSFFFPVLDDTEVPAEVREGVRSIMKAGGLDALIGELKRRNPGGFTGLDEQNPRRVQNALERCIASGKTLDELQKAYRDMPAPFPQYGKRICLLSRGREDLWERIERRTRKMLAAGLVDEVRRLRDEGFEANPSAASAIGYREVLNWLDAGGTDADALADTIAQNTRKLVKKQRSFLRSQIPSGNVVDLAPGDSRAFTGDLFGACL